jgi:hypothetical protein
VTTKVVAASSYQGNETANLCIIFLFEFTLVDVLMGEFRNHEDTINSTLSNQMAATSSNQMRNNLPPKP